MNHHAPHAAATHTKSPKLSIAEIRWFLHQKPQASEDRPSVLKGDSLIKHPYVVQRAGESIQLEHASNTKGYKFCLTDLPHQHRGFYDVLFEDGEKVTFWKSSSTTTAVLEQHALDVYVYTGIEEDD